LKSKDCKRKEARRAHEGSTRGKQYLWGQMQGGGTFGKLLSGENPNNYITPKLAIKKIRVWRAASKKGGVGHAGTPLTTSLLTSKQKMKRVIAALSGGQQSIQVTDRNLSIGGNWKTNCFRR